jgi:hypothetical protein
VDRNELADAAGGRSASVGRRFDRRHVAANDGGDIAGADFFPPDQRHFRRFDHRVRRFDHRDETLGLDHPECLTHYISPVSSG